MLHARLPKLQPALQVASQVYMCRSPGSNTKPSHCASVVRKGELVYSTCTDGINEAHSRRTVVSSTTTAFELHAGFSCSTCHAGFATGL